jgi:FtsX-like permease family
MAASIHKVVQDIDPAIPIQESGTWRKQLALQLFPARAATVALSLFGVFGLLLSITGTFGLASYTVAKRMRELGICVALGAQRKQIVSAALGRTIVLVATGSLAGLALGICSRKAAFGNRLPCLCSRPIGVVRRCRLDAVQYSATRAKQGNYRFARSKI